MTCIAAIVDHETKKAWIGGDSCGTRGDSRDEFASPKIWKTTWQGRTLLFGASGRSRFQQILEFCVPLPDETFDEKKESLRAFLVRHWVPRIQRYLKEMQFDEVASQTIFTYKGEIYLIDSCLAISHLTATHYAIGSGGLFAHGGTEKPAWPEATHPQGDTRRDEALHRHRRQSRYSHGLSKVPGTCAWDFFLYIKLFTSCACGESSE